MMRNIKVTIEYDGTDFHGWQKQPKGRRTVQGELEKALFKLFGKSIKVIGAGRTDRGVHAAGQVANFRTSASMPTEEIVRALNAHLPAQIAVLDAQDAAKDFHAQYNAKSKIYRYVVLCRKTRSVFQERYSLHFPHKINVSSMRKEARFLIGRKDFKSFEASDPARRSQKGKKSTVRTMKRVEIIKKGDYLFMEFEANGFLYKMARNIAGTLLAIGGGRLSQNSIKGILARKNRTSAGATAKAKGLCLVEVKY